MVMSKPELFINTVWRFRSSGDVVFPWFRGPVCVIAHDGAGLGLARGAQRSR